MESIEPIVRNIVEKEKNEIREKRKFVRNMERVAWGFGWKWGQEHPITSDEVDTMRSFSKENKK